VADIRHEEDRTMSNFSKRALRWTAPVALVGALGLAACGDNDDSEATRIAAPSGVNAWLSEQAIEREAQLDNRAAELAQQERAYQAASARLTAQAEQVERSAHLEGQAKTYSGTGVPTAFEAGNRAAQMAQAEAYVEQQQDRAESSSYDGEFLPGSRHVPTR
jgi:prolyl-tRNA synthetase